MRAKGHLVRAVLGVSVLVSVNGPLLADAPPMLDTPAASAASASPQQAPKATLSGKVIAARTGQTLAGAELFLVYSEPDGGADQRLVAKTTSAADGSYSFANAIDWPKARPSSERGSQGQCYFLFAVHPDLGMSFACLLPGDRTDNLQVKLFEKKINTVKVVDQDGKPVVGVTVHYQGGGITEKDAPELDNAHRYAYLRQDIGVLSAVTDAQGEVRLPGLYDGCNYSAEKEGFTRGYGQTEIPLLPGREVKGQITYPDGKPAAGARVKCYFSGESLGWNDYTRADAQGRYRFAGVPVIGYYYGFSPAAKGNTKGTLTISAELEDPSSGLISKPVSFPAKLEDTQERNVVMTRGVIVGGKIVDDRTGKPLPGIALECYGLATGQQSYDLKTAKTDENGHFQTTVSPGSRFFLRWEDSREGDYVIDYEWLRHQPHETYEYEPFQMEAVNADKTDIVLKLRLWDLLPLEGKVVDEQGKPVANAVVHMSRHLSAVKADPAGVFTLKAAPKDRDFELCVMSTDSKLGTIQKFPAGTKTATITLHPTVTREGMVTTPAGVAADNLKFYRTLTLNRESNYRLQVEITTDAKGQFKAEHLIPGAKYSLSWSSDNETNRDYDYGNAEVDLATLKDADPIRFTASKYVNAIMGQVVDPTGKPVPGAKVAIEGQSELVTQDQRFNRAQPFTADKEGNFTIPRLADGELTLKVTAPGWKPTAFKTATDNVDAKITMRSLAEPTLYRATVKDAQGNPVAGAAVTLFSQRYSGSKMEKSQVTRKTDVSGVVTFDSPTTAPTTRPVQFSQNVMFCDAPGYDLAVSPGAAANEDLDAQFTLTQSEKHWKGKVVNSQNQPIAGAKIQVTGIRSQGNEYGSLPTDEETQIAATGFTSGADGTFELTRIPHTWVNIRVSLPGLRAVNGYFDPQGTTASVDQKTFVLQQGTSVKGKLVIKGTGQPPAIPPNNHSTYVNTYVGFLNSADQPCGFAHLKPDGTFSTEELEPGTYKVQLTSWQDGLLKYVVKTPPTVETKVGETANVVVEMEEGLCLKGKLTGVKLEKTMGMDDVFGDVYGVVTATRPGSPGNVQEASHGKIHKDGTWSLYLPEPGEYAINYTLPPADDGQSREKAGKTIKIEPGKTPEEVVITDKP